MKNITYGIFAEDTANEIFIENAIPQFISHFGYEKHIFFDHDKEYTEVMIAKSGEYLFDNFIKHVAVGIKKFGIEVCFVGLDADDSNYLEIYEDMVRRLENDKLEKKALIFIPVQAIEYWLWYIKEKKENPDIKSTPKIESIRSRTEMKKLIYNRKKPRNKLSNPIVNELSKNIDFNWLKIHSASFHHFYSQLEKYLKSNFETMEEEE